MVGETIGGSGLIVVRHGGEKNFAGPESQAGGTAFTSHSLYKVKLKFPLNVIM